MTSIERSVHIDRLERNAMLEKHRRIKFLCNFKEAEEKYRDEFYMLECSYRKILNLL